MKLNYESEEVVNRSGCRLQEEEMIRVGRDLRYIAEAFRQSRHNYHQMLIDELPITTSRSNIAIYLARFLFNLICGPLSRSNQQQQDLDRHIRIESERDPKHRLSDRKKTNDINDVASI